MALTQYIFILPENTDAQCRSMSTEDIRLALATELEAWTPPQDVMIDECLSRND
ncbi:hypothetical protein OF076_004772 [Escherichia coli]|nr:hypothetical protein [Escherichia coli]